MNRGNHGRVGWALLLLYLAACKGSDDGAEPGTGGGGGSAGSAGTAGTSGAAGSAGGGTCTTNQECTERATTEAGGGPVVLATCVKPAMRCVPLLSLDCDTITGELREGSIIIGSLFQTKQPQPAINIARQRAAVLAVEQINHAAGGIPSGETSAGVRSLVMVSCNAYPDPTAPAGMTGLLSAARHLVNDLHVPAIVGPNTSQDTIDVSLKVTIPGKSVVISPSALAGSIATLTDDNLTWLMVPNDVQRGPAMIDQINMIESDLRATITDRDVKLSIIYRDDALGLGTKTSLGGMSLNGKPIADQLASSVKISPYSPAAPGAGVDEQVAFAPDIVVLAGTAEVVSQIMVPLENGWQNGVNADSARPHYVLIDSAKVPDLLEAVKAEPTPPTLKVPYPDDLRRRVRGTGITPGAAKLVFDAFRIAYVGRYPGRDVDVPLSGVGPAYDATYAIAFALAAKKDVPLTGPNTASGLRQLAGGTNPFNTGEASVLPIFQKLGAGQTVAIKGTYGPLAWDSNGSVAGGTLEVWCVNRTPAYMSSGRTFDLVTKAEPSAIDASACGWD